MDNKNVETNQTEQVKPTPATPAPQAETTPNEAVKPAEHPVENVDKKQTAAFIKMRQEARELKRKLAEVSAVAPAPVQTETPAPPVQNVAPQAPTANKVEMDIEAESAKAIEAISVEKDVMAVPGGILDIINMVDTDPRLSRLHNIDPMLAFKEAKSIWLSRTGITAPPTIPVSAPVSGGIPPGGEDFKALIEAAERAKPGTKEFFELANKVNAEMKKLNKL